MGVGYSVLDEAVDPDLVKWFTVDEPTKTVTTEYSFIAGLNSLGVGTSGHLLHSGGQNLFTENVITRINFFPCWQGVKELQTVGEHLGLNPTVRHYSDTGYLYTNGLSPTSDNVVYTDSITLVDNESVIRLRVHAGEVYEGELVYTIDVQNQRRYEQRLQVDVQVGDEIIFKAVDRNDFSQPSESFAGEIIDVDILKEDGTPFLVKSGTNTTKPWLELVLATFQDVPVLSTTQYVTESFTVRYSGDYEVNTSGGSITVTVPLVFKDTFYVSDAAQSFNPTSSCTIDFSAFGQPNFVMDSSREAYKFYYDKLANQWRYKDLNTKSGGVV